jgi:energy-coupling factor transport system permease protein
MFEGLRFRRGDSLIHRLDPRTKFAVSCLIFALALMFTELHILVLLFIFQIPLIYLANTQREWLRSIRGGTSLTLIIFFTNFIVGFLSGTPLGIGLIIYSMSLAFRFIVLMSSFSIFFLTTSPDDLSIALEQSHIPYEFCFAFTTAIRFVPVLAAEAQTIIDAQKSRGLELEKGSFMKRVKNYIPILIPLIVGAIRRSLELAEAMESRAFGARKNRTNLYTLSFSKTDYLVLFLVVLTLFLSVFIRLTY